MEKEAKKTRKDIENIKVNAEEVSPKSFDFRGGKYAFDADAPQHIRFAGGVYTQEELIADEDAIVQLIGGNSSLIIKL